MMIRFTAHCARDHDRVDFTDPKAFEAHCTTVHKARKIGRPGIANPNPIPWKAPKAPATTEKLTAVLVKAEAGDYTPKRGRWQEHLEAGWHTDEIVSTTDLEPGDVFVAAEATGVRYTVLETDPEKGWHLEMVGSHAQAGSAKRGWLRELKLWSGVLETVIRLERAA